MAGGIGSRFWPVSTSEFPKQFHDMLGTGETLIQRTYKRLLKLIPEENICVLTHTRYADLVKAQIPEIKSDQIFIEPMMRNTAPCILYAALKIKKDNPDASMVVAPSDHWIEDENAFIEDLKTCFDVCAREDKLMTLGIQPTFPNTGYGYIQYKNDQNEGIKDVVQFTEKPNYEKAKTFIEAGNYLWNAGIFVWSVSSILKSFTTFQKEMTNIFEHGYNIFNTEAEKEFINTYYKQVNSISIDYAILEKATNVFVLPASFDWNDLGTWGSLYEKLNSSGRDNVVVNTKVVAENAKGNIIRASKDKLVVVDGIHDYIIVDKEDVLLIYPKNKEQDIKQVLVKVSDKHGDKYC